MDFFSFPPLAAALDATHTVLIALTDLLTPLAGSLAAALAVVLVTLLVRTALIPVGVSQARAEQNRARLAPRLRTLQERHRRDPERLQRETMRLYADEGVSPLAGCLPMLAQAPVIGLIYAVFLHPSIAGHPNQLLAESLFGVPLGTSALGALLAGGEPAAFAVFGGIVLVLIGIGETSRRAFPVLLEGPAARMAPALGLVHYATAVVALFVPLAAALYLCTTTAWTLAQRILLRRRYPLPPVSKVS